MSVSLNNPCTYILEQYGYLTVVCLIYKSVDPYLLYFCMHGTEIVYVIWEGHIMIECDALDIHVRIQVIYRVPTVAKTSTLQMIYSFDFEISDIVLICR